MSTTRRSLRKTKAKLHKSRKTLKSKNRKSKSRSRSHKHGSNKKRALHNMRGGYGSDWISSQYSLGSANSAEQSAAYVGQFSNSQAGSRADYMTPPNLGSAGSGGSMGDLEGASVRSVGAPLI